MRPCTSKFYYLLYISTEKASYYKQRHYLFYYIIMMWKKIELSYMQLFYLVIILENTNSFRNEVYLAIRSIFFTFTIFSFIFFIFPFELLCSESISEKFISIVKSSQLNLNFRVCWMKFLFSRRSTRQFFIIFYIV